MSQAINPVVPLTEAQFRGIFTEFADPKKYGAGKVNMYLGIIQAKLSLNNWGELYTLGCCLFVAHFLVLDRRNQQEDELGREPGTQVGPLGGESAGGVSVSYDVGAAVNPTDGHWNLTNYGTRFIHESKLCGAGPQQVGFGWCPPNSGPAWPGPWNMTLPEY